MGKTFEHTDEDGDRIYVLHGLMAEEFVVGVKQDGANYAYESYVPREQAPALALAVLEAAGYSPTQSTSMGAIAAALREQVRQQAAAAQEAADREALEREAEELYRASYSDPACYSADYWRTCPHTTRDLWLGVARAARKLHQKEEGK